MTEYIDIDGHKVDAAKADHFYSQRDGRRVTDAEWDEERKRIIDKGYAASLNKLTTTEPGGSASPLGIRTLLAAPASKAQPRQWSPLTTSWSVTTDSSPRHLSVDSIGHHHAASTSLGSVLAMMQPGGREVSSNYVISGKNIVGVVPETRRAWTSGDPDADSRSITYEVVNASASPDWSFYQDTVESIIALDADISEHYGIPLRHGIPGFWEHRNLFEWFKRSYATACAGPSFNIRYIIDRTIARMSEPKKGTIEVIHYHHQDPTARGGGRTLAPGGGVYLHTTKGAPASNATNIVGGIGTYSITPHVYAEGTPGDQVDVTLMWQNVRTSPVQTSAHYVERLVIGPDGTLRASREFKRAVAEGFAVYVRVDALSSNKGDVRITLLDSDAFMFTA